MSNVIKKGEKFGDLIVIREFLINDKLYYMCRCQCGKTIIVSIGSLLNGTYLNCGCKK